jgi:hypothetical protein
MGSKQLSRAQWHHVFRSSFLAFLIEEYAEVTMLEVIVH